MTSALRPHRWSLATATLAVTVSVAFGCSPGPRPMNTRCTTQADCEAGETCEDNRCVAGVDAAAPDASGPRDAGPLPDAPFARPFCPDFPFTLDDCGDPEIRPVLDRRDSDGDGLSDGAELCVHGTDPCNEDTDGDGVSDLIEVSYGSDPLDPADNPRARGDFVFVVPYSAPGEAPIDPDPTRDALSFATDLQKVDVYITIDMSGSMGGEIQNLTDGFRDVVLPGLSTAVPDIRVGVGRFQHCPATSSNNGMLNLVDLTDDFEPVAAALAAMPGTLGGSVEPYRLKLWLLATGDTSAFGGYHSGSVNPVPRRCEDPDAIGWPCFRPDAVRIIIQAGDERMSGSNANCAPMSGITHGQTVDALNAAGPGGIRYIGINSGTGSQGTDLESEMRQMAVDTATVDATTDAPIYFRIPADGSGLDDSVVSAVTDVSRNIPLRVDANPVNDPDNPGGVNAIAAFIERIEPNITGAEVEGRICTDLPVVDETGDGFPDHFPRVFPGTSVCFDIIPQPNQTVPSTDEPQVFRATVRVIGDLFTPLDEREVLFLVPPGVFGPD